MELTNGKVNINVTSIAQSDGDLYACGLWGRGGEISLNDAEVTVETQTPHQVGYSNTYGVMLEGGSTLKMKDGFIHVTATDSKNEAFTGIATGIQTMSGSGDYKISLGKVDILTKGIEAVGLELSQTMMDMAGGNVEAESLGGQAQGLNATSGTTFTATGDISFTARAEGNKAVALRAEGDSSIMALGGTVTASGDRTEYDSVGATGLESHNGGVITKTGGDVTVVSATGVTIGLEAKDNSYNSGEYRASRITYGNADAVTLVNVQGMNAYGIRTWKETDTSDGLSSSVELTNGDIRVSSNGATAMGAYSVSGNIALKGTTAITASAGTSGGNVYSLYATSFGSESSTINVERASTITGDMATATNSASVTVSFQDGGKLEGWTRSLGTMELSFGKNAVWEMVSSNNLAKGDDGKYAANLTKLALDDSHVYVGSTQKQWEAGSGFASSQTLLSQTDAPAELKIKELSGSGNFYLRTDMQQDISDSVRVTDGLSGSHKLHVKASGAEPV